MPTYPLLDISLEGRAIVMTGGDRGLGRSMALALARCGASLVIASVDEEGANGSPLKSMKSPALARDLPSRPILQTLDNAGGWWAGRSRHSTGWTFCSITRAD